jgi:hypothetical protein
MVKTKCETIISLIGHEEFVPVIMGQKAFNFIGVI